MMLIRLLSVKSGMMLLRWVKALVGRGGGGVTSLWTDSSACWVTCRTHLEKMLLQGSGYDMVPNSDTTILLALMFLL